MSEYLANIKINLLEVPTQVNSVEAAAGVRPGLAGAAGFSIASSLGRLKGLFRRLPMAMAARRRAVISRPVAQSASQPISISRRQPLQTINNQPQVTQKPLQQALPVTRRLEPIKLQQEKVVRSNFYSQRSGQPQVVGTRERVVGGAQTRGTTPFLGRKQKTKEELEIESLRTQLKSVSEVKDQAVASSLGFQKRFYEQSTRLGGATSARNKYRELFELREFGRVRTQAERSAGGFGFGDQKESLSKRAQQLKNILDEPDIPTPKQAVGQTFIVNNPDEDLYNNLRLGERQR